MQGRFRVDTIMSGFGALARGVRVMGLEVPLGLSLYGPIFPLKEPYNSPRRSES